MAPREEVRPVCGVRSRGARRLFALLLAGLVYGLAAGDAAAQEAQVAFDEGGRIEVIDVALAQRLGVFIGEYPGFVEARLLETERGEYALEVLVRRDGRSIRERRTLTAAEVAVLRARIGGQAAVAGASRASLPDARHSLLGRSTLLGLALYGWALPVALDVEDEKAFTGLYMVTASASFIAPWMLTQNRYVAPAAANLSWYGATRGFLHGALIHYVLLGHEQRRRVCDWGDCYFEDDFPSRGAIGIGFATGLGEAVAGYAVASSRGMTAGTASAIANGGDFGLAAGLAASHVFGIDDEDDARATAAMALAGNAAGLAAGWLIAPRRDFTHGDVEVISTAGWLGAFSAASALDVVGVENSRALVGGAMLGGLTGLIVGDRLVRHHEFTASQARLVGLGTVAGALLGAGMGVLAEPEGGDGSWITTAASVGALAGFGVTYTRLAPAAARAMPLSSSLSVEVSPHALAGLALPSLAGDGGVSLPLVSARYRF